MAKMSERMRRAYEDALQVQNACNLSGVLESWKEHLPVLQEEVLHKEGTDAFNRHPVNVLFSSKVADLTGSEVLELYQRSYQEAQDALAEPVEA